jgi:hypothetical protein
MPYIAGDQLKGNHTPEQSPCSSNLRKLKPSSSLSSTITTSCFCCCWCCTCSAAITAAAAATTVALLLLCLWTVQLPQQLQEGQRVRHLRQFAAVT